MSHEAEMNALSLDITHLYLAVMLGTKTDYTEQIIKIGKRLLKNGASAEMMEGYARAAATITNAHLDCMKTALGLMENCGHDH